MKKLVLNIALSLLTLLGVTSCNIKEDMSNCPGSMILDYSAYSNEILDDIASSEQIDVFIFDTNGICCDILTFTYGYLRDTGFEFELPIKYRGYNAVVWQGLNSENYNSESMVLGANYEDFYLQLEYDNANKCYENVPDPLWATPLEPIDFCAKITRHRVYMTRLHTEVNVSVQQKMSDGTLNDLAIGEYHPIISATNNRYHTDYDICSQSINLDYTDEHYDPVSIIHNSHMCTCVGTLRITPDRKCSLEVIDSNSDNLLIGSNKELNLVHYMLETKSDDTLTDQQFLDRNKIWDINLIVKETIHGGYTVIAIDLNGWVIWLSNEGLS